MLALPSIPALKAGAAVAGVLGASAALAFGAGFFVSEIRKHDAFHERMYDRGHDAGRTEAAAEQAAEIFRLQVEAAEATAREAAARRDANDEIDRITRDAEARIAEALARARRASGGDGLRRPVPAGLRLRPGPAVSGFRGQADSGGDPVSDA